MKFADSRIATLAMVATLIAIAVLGQRFSPLLLPKANVTGIVEAGCDLRQRACSAALPEGGTVQLSITPRPIPSLQALRVEVSTSGIEARKVEVDFAGASMNMGYNRTQLAATGAGRYGGDSSLPVCVSGRMNWVATVMIETARQRIAVSFRFDVGR